MCPRANLLFLCNQCIRRFLAVKHGNKIFLETGCSGQRLPWALDPELWARWRDGTTGLPLVDANMREMNATGALLLHLTPPQTCGLLSFTSVAETANESTVNPSSNYHRFLFALICNFPQAS